MRTQRPNLIGKAPVSDLPTQKPRDPIPLVFSALFCDLCIVESGKFLIDQRPVPPSFVGLTHPRLKVVQDIANLVLKAGASAVVPEGTADVDVLELEDENTTVHHNSDRKIHRADEHAVARKLSRPRRR